MITVHTARIRDLPDLVPLFDAYRVFYGQASDPGQAFQFLKDRIKKDQSVILMARKTGVAAGFVQLYPCFSSVSLRPVFILNDLFVRDSHRNSGVGSTLLEAAKGHCIASGSKGLALETAANNPAQWLYERMGWVKDSHCFHYFWTAP